MNAVAARRGKRRRLPSPSHTFSSPRRSSKLVFLCVLCGHTTSTGGENIKRQRALAAQTLSQAANENKIGMCSSSPCNDSPAKERDVWVSLSLGEKTKKEKGSCLVAITTGGWERRFPARHRRCSLDLRGGGNRRSSLAGRGGQTSPRCGVGWWWEVMAGLVASGGSSSGGGEGDGWARRRMRRGAGPCSVQYVHRGEGREAGAKTTAAAASPTGGRSPSRRLPPPPPLPRPSLRPGSRPGRPCAGGRPPWGT